ANITAGTLDIKAGRNFVLTSPESLFHAGGDPGGGTSPWHQVQTLAENYGTGVAANTTSANGNFSAAGQAAVAAGLAAGPVSNIIAANNVVIVANELNVNGVIQSGIADYNVNITAAQQAQINAAETARAQFLAGQFAAAQATVNAAGLKTDDYLYFR